MKTRIFLLLVVTLASAPALANESYIPVFQETGVSNAASRPGVEVSVNYFGGNATVQQTDLSLPAVSGVPVVFSRVHNSGGLFDDSTSAVRELRKRDSPLGAGWTAHYGFLNWVDPDGPFWERPDGGRELFYFHDTLTALDVSCSGTLCSRISTSLNVLVGQRNDPTLTLLMRDGRRYTLTRETNSVFVPTRIEDASENSISIEYADNWSNDYPDHPVVSAVVDSWGSRFTFETVRNASVNNRYRIEAIKLGTRVLASYSFKRLNGVVYLDYHETPEGRRTSFDYFQSGDQVGAMKTITRPEGGVWTLAYEVRPFRGPTGAAYVLAATSLSRGTTGTWTYTYPSETNSAGEFTVDVAGPDGFSGKYTFFNYPNGNCADADLDLIGLMKRSETSFNGTSRTETMKYDHPPLAVSTQRRWSGCGPQVAAIPLMSEREVDQDGYEFLTEYSYSASSFDQPSSTSSPGSVEDIQTFESRSTYSHSTGTGSYWVAYPTSTEREVSGARVTKTVFHNLNAAGQPAEIHHFHSSSSKDVSALQYFSTAGTNGKRGAAKKLTRGAYTEDYDYDHGVLKSVTYSTGPNVSRGISTLGEVDWERANGVQRDFAYDDDLRLDRIEDPDGDLSDVTIVHTVTSTTVTQAAGSDGVKTEIVTTFDDWGLLKKREETLTQAVGSKLTSSYDRDAFGQVTLETLPSGQKFQMAYDVNGRVRSRVNSGPGSARHSEIYSYSASSTGVTETQTLNSSVVRRRKYRHDGRLAEASLNGNNVTYAYSDSGGQTTQTITPQSGAPRTVVFDLLGRKKSETHPEYGGPITYDYVASRSILDRVSFPEFVLDYTHDSRNRLTSVTRGAKTVFSASYHPTYGARQSLTSGSGVAWSAQFDGEGRPNSITYTIPGHLRRLEPRNGGSPRPFDPSDAGVWLDFPVNGPEYLPLPLGGAGIVAGMEHLGRIREYDLANAPVMTWDDVGADSYEVQLKFGSETRTMTVESNRVAVTDFSVVYEHQGGYQMRVRPRQNSGEVGPWSRWWSSSSSCSGANPAYTSTPSISLKYDANGRIKEITHPSGRVQKLDYASNGATVGVSSDSSVLADVTGLGTEGQLETFTLGTPAFAAKTVNISHDPLGRMDALQFPQYSYSVTEFNDWGYVGKATRSDYLDGTIEYTYGQHGELTAYSFGGLDLGYSYDVQGNLTGVGVAGSFSGLSYDGWSRQFDGKNRAVGSAYDRNGRITSDGVLSYEYNGLGGQLRAIKDAFGVTEAHYLYDGDGLRARSVEGDTVTYTLRGPDGRPVSQIVYEPSEDGCEHEVKDVDLFYLGSEQFASVSRHDAVDTWRLTLRDEGGNPVLDFENGVNQTTGDGFVQYEPYGGVLTSDGSAENLRFGFAGHETGNLSLSQGLTYVMARHYNSKLGRFTTPDPAFAFDETNPLTYNLYEYGFNNPVAYRDRNGLNPQMESEYWASLFGYDSVWEANRVETPDQAVTGFQRQLPNSLTFGLVGDAHRPKTWMGLFGTVSADYVTTLVHAIAFEYAASRVVRWTRGRAISTREFHFADRSWFDDVHGYRALKASIQNSGLKNTVIEYVEIGGHRYVVRGNGRLQVAEDLKITEQLQFRQVELPFQGYRNEADVLEEANSIIYNLPRGAQ